MNIRIFLSLICFASFAGCGIPDHLGIDPPEGVDLTGSTRLSLAFQTSSNVQYITGYAVYYKIYAGNSDRMSEGENDKGQFSDSAHSSGELPSGNSVPKKRGYFKIGREGSQTVDDEDLTISAAEIGANTIVTLKFDAEKIIVYTDSVANPIVNLVRGIVDHRKKNDSLLSFQDWDFSGNTEEDMGWFDSDLRRNTDSRGLLDHQPVDNEEDYDAIRNKSKPLDDLVEPLQIGIAVHSVGRDDSILKPLASKPVHLGFIETQKAISSQSR